MKLYEIALTKRGYHVTSLTDSLEALDTFRGRPLAFDIIMVDQDMPELTDTEFSAQVLLERPYIPIILVTGYSVDVSEEFLKTSGIRQCFMKPLNAT
ncbi:MAG: response regulator, partial [Gammaproteobacteria bacterium]|nr:response regulator [Gammaproteobacteria bacterium]